MNTPVISRVWPAVVDPLFSNVRTIAHMSGSASAAGRGSNAITYGRAVNGVSASPLTAADVAEYAHLEVIGTSAGTGVGSFNIPFTMAWLGAMGNLVADSNYAIFVGSWSGGNTLNQAGYGVRVIDKDTLQLCVYVGGALYTTNVTVTGFLDNTTGAHQRQSIVLKWNGSNTLDLYAAFAVPGAALAKPTYRGTLTQAASGNTYSSHLRHGLYSTGTSVYTQAPALITNSIYVREG